jgi:hypothetical protein
MADTPAESIIKSLLEGIELETPCTACEGEGGLWKWSEAYQGREWGRCDECNGAGYVPTAIGRKLLAFMRHNFGGMYVDYRELVDRREGGTPRLR